MPTTYAVQSGDSLSRIARTHGITLAELLKANPQFGVGGRDPDLIYPNEEIDIPEQSSFSSEANVKTGRTECRA
jgi:LysM repeat protein